MGNRSIEFAEREFYHIYNRGVEKRTIYLDERDHERFLELLYAANTVKPTDLRSISRVHESVYEWDRGESLVAIGAYCLMPNHFHLLLTPLREGGVSAFMNKLCTSYSMYFNRRYERTGALFEGKFKAKHADSDEYLKYLFAYIHLNPVKLLQSDWKERGIQDVEKAYEFVSQFRYSSLRDFQHKFRPEQAILETTPFPMYFESAAAEKAELVEWLSYADDGAK
ncbi:transposase [Candidatus Kaiserbacteria bacterium]|nr:transposase [Candidatus Kaiserbacteria bacterium]MCB9812532.1 transposase [Candidatus Nomurabacteria bacterium]